MLPGGQGPCAGGHAQGAPGSQPRRGSRGPRAGAPWSRARGVAREGDGEPRHRGQGATAPGPGGRNGATRRARGPGRGRVVALEGWGGVAPPRQGAGEGHAPRRGVGEGLRRRDREPRVGTHAREGKGGVARRGTRGRAQGREGEKEGERERGEGSSPRGSKFGDHRLQILGHHREKRERWRRGSWCAGELNERKEEKGGGARMGRGRAPGARGPGPGQARPGQAGSRRGSKSHDTHNH
jgi:hypothetical protein